MAIKALINRMQRGGILNAGKALYSRYWFELKYGIRMNPSSGQGNIDKNDPLLKGHVKYEPVSHYSFNRMLNNINWDYAKSTFIDFGCGKGAAILLASRYGFKKYIGVEYDPKLVDECRVNIRKFFNHSKKDIDHEIYCIDATRYAIPETVNVFYFFNPFDNTLLDAVLQNIEESVKANPRDILLLYFNAVHKDVIEKYRYRKVYDEPVDKINIWYQNGNYAYIRPSVPE